MTGDQVDPAIALLSDNGFVVTWTSPALIAGQGSQVFAQRFDSNGVAVGTQIQVDPSHTATNESHASVSSLVGGGFVVVWTVSGGADGSGDGVYEQRYSASGSALGVVKVNTTTAGDQNNASVTSLINGGFLVTWTGAGTGGNGAGVFSQAYDALGQPVGTETQIGAPAGYNQTDAKVTTLPNGNFVVSWTSQDGSGTGISAEVFSDLVTIQGVNASYRPEISPDGRYITFSSDASNLVSGDTSGAADTFIYDRVTETLQRVSTNSLGQQSFGDEGLGDGVNSGGSIVSFGGIAIAASQTGSAPQLQADGKTIKFTAGGISDLGGSDQLTLTAKVGHGKLSASGLTIVSGQDGSNGTLVATGTVAQINAAVQAGLFYTPTGSGNDALLISITDSLGASYATSIGFTPQGTEIPALSFNNSAQQAHAGANGSITFSGISLSSLDPTQHAVTLTASVQHGTLASANSLSQLGLSIVNGLDGSNGTLEVTGSASAISAALNAGVVYTGSQGASDTLTLVVNDGYFQGGQAIQFNGTGNVTVTVLDHEPGIVTSDIFVVDRSSGGSGTVLDDPAYVSAADPSVPAVSPINVQFNQTPGIQSIWIDQGRPNPAITSQSTLQKWGEVFNIPSNQSDLSAVSLKVSAPSSSLGGATFFELKLYEWSQGAATGPAIYDSGKIALGLNGAGIGPTLFSLPLDVAVQSGKQYVLEIVGDGAIGLATAAAVNSSEAQGDGLYSQSSNGAGGFNAWQPVSGSSIFGELDFKPALTTTGLLSFTDTNDTHTVSVAADGQTWGHLVAYVSSDTTGSNTAGSVTWAYEVDPNKAATLALGEQHFDTFSLTLTDSNGGTATTNVTVTVAGSDETPKITSAQTAPPGQPIGFVADNNVAGGYLTTANATSGTITFKDVDLSDTHTVTATLTGATWSSGTSSFANGAGVDDLPPAAEAFFANAMSAAVSSDSTWVQSNTGTISWSLADIPAYLAHFLGQNQTLTLTYTIEVDDPHLASDTQTLTVTIAHTAPAFIGWTGGALDGNWNNPDNWSTGSVPKIGDDVHIPDEEVLGAGPYQVTNTGSGSTAAAANSITLRTADASLINTGNMSVAQALTLDPDSSASNSGNLTVGSATLADSSSLNNSGHFVAGTLTASHGDYRQQCGRV